MHQADLLDLRDVPHVIGVVRLRHALVKLRTGDRLSILCPDEHSRLLTEKVVHLLGLQVIDATEAVGSTVYEVRKP